MLSRAGRRWNGGPPGVYNGGMSDSPWDLKMKAFLKRTGEDFKRFGRDVKDEAEKLVAEVRDPEKQAKLRDGLREVGAWARKAAEDVAGAMETGVKKAEDALRQGARAVGERPPQGAAEPPPAAAPTPPAPPPDMPEAPAPRPRARPAAKSKRPASGKAPAARKTIGKKGTPRGE
jgi:hypothetical protein